MLRLLSFAVLLTYAMAQWPTVSPIAQPPFPGFEPCNICGEGMTVSFLTRALQFSGFPELSCKALQEAGLDGFIDPAVCPFLTSSIFDPCKCVVGSPTTPTPAPIVAPTLSPAQPTMATLSPVEPNGNDDSAAASVTTFGTIFISFAAPVLASIAIAFS